MSTPRPFSIRIFVADGLPAGVRTVEKSNWSGRGVVMPRSRYNDVRHRPEFAKAGVYVLVGQSESTGATKIYVGEGDPIRPRLDSHASQKDFWTQAFAFVSKDDNLNKAHVQFLEARLIELARQAKRCELENAKIPERSSLSEADVAEVEGFLSEMLLCFPVLGLPAFEEAPAAPKARIRLVTSGKGAKAAGFESEEGFVVEKGSTAVLSETPTIPAFASGLRRQLLDAGVLRATSEVFVFEQPYVFSSPSTASTVVLGRNTNGRLEWCDERGRTLKEIQESGRSQT
jgi:hypothetical protein